MNVNRKAPSESRLTTLYREMLANARRARWQQTAHLSGGAILTVIVDRGVALVTVRRARVPVSPVEIRVFSRDFFGNEQANHYTTEYRRDGIRWYSVQWVQEATE